MYLLNLMNKFTTFQFAKSLKPLFLSVLCVNLISSQTLFAVEIQITASRNLRDTTTDTNGALQVVGRLTAGSVIDIPDKYAVLKNGKLNFDKSVQKWTLALKDKDAKTPVFAKFDGKKQDYFIPVKIVQAADGSRVGENKDVFISIRDVGVVKDAATKTVAMQTTRDTNLVAKKPAKNTAMEVTCNGYCDQIVSPMNQLSDSAKQMKAFAALATAPRSQVREAKVAVTKSSDTATQRYLQISDKFRATCHMELSDFTKVIDQKVKGTPFKTEEILAIMGQESKGECFPISKTGTPMKHGLFGIQDKNSTISENVCSPAQGTAIRSIVKSNDHVFERLNAFKTDGKINCVGNPFLNLDASLRILTGKETYIRSKSVDADGKYTQATIKKLLFYYNGNPTYQSQYVRIVAPLSELLGKAIAQASSIASNND